MKLIRKKIETGEALELFLGEVRANAEKSWPQVERACKRAGFTIHDNDEAKRAWITAVAATDTSIMGDSRHMSQAELSHILDALDAQFGGDPLYDYFKSLIFYSLAQFSPNDFGRLSPLINGLILVMRCGLDEAETAGDEPGSIPTELLRDIGILFSLQLSAWKRIFENYNVTFTAV
jgi:hypothetical protein